MIREIAGRKVSPVGIGTWGIGGTSAADNRHDREHIEALKFAIDQGITFIDTAEVYSAGHSEELVGKAIRDVPREDVFVTTKVWHNHLRHDEVIKAARGSLSRLDTPYIDLYLIYWPNRSVPLRETLGAMEELVDQGLVKNIGVSNFDVKEVQEAMENASRHEIVANQIEYSIVKMKCESDIIPYCEENNVRIIAYSPINRGNLKSLKSLNRLAENISHSPVSVALNYLMKRSIPIPKSSSKEHIMQFMEAMEFELSDHDYGMLKK